jgi:hypothetical protein
MFALAAREVEKAGQVRHELAAVTLLYVPTLQGVHVSAVLAFRTAL